MIAEFLRSCRSAMELLLPVCKCMHLVDSVHIYSIYDLNEIQKEKLGPRLASYLLTVTCLSFFA